MDARIWGSTFVAASALPFALGERDRRFQYAKIANVIGEDERELSVERRALLKAQASMRVHEGHIGRVGITEVRSGAQFGHGRNQQRLRRLTQLILTASGNRMPDIASMLRTHPRQSPEADALAKAASSLANCAQICLVCADACLAEKEPQKLAQCIRLDLDCAAICEATASVLLRAGQPGPQPMQAIVAACSLACDVCAQECRKHASMHEHCRLCAEACEACHTACEGLLKAMRHAGESEGARKQHQAHA